MRFPLTMHVSPCLCSFTFTRRLYLVQGTILRKKDEEEVKLLRMVLRFRREVRIVHVSLVGLCCIQEGHGWRKSCCQVRIRGEAPIFPLGVRTIVLLWLSEQACVHCCCVLL